MLKFKVLLIDDEPGALEGMQLWINWEKLGFEVCGMCSNGEEGLRLIREHKPDLVITDVHMPVLSGLDMISEWQKEGGEGVKFIIVSGYSDFEYARRALRYGVSHYMLKPVIGEEAEKEIEKIRSELLQERDHQSIEQIAGREEMTSLIRQSLSDEGSVAFFDKAKTLSAICEVWGLCLVQADPDRFAALRDTAAALADEEPWVFLVDLEPGSFTLVYGVSAADDKLSEQHPVLARLMAACQGERVFISLGEEQDSLLHLGSSLASAREAAQHKFYDSSYDGLVRYEDISKHSFSHQYQIQLINGMIQAAELLDAAAFKEEAEKVSSLFRELRLSPEIVRKMVIHVMFHIESLGAQAAAMDPSADRSVQAGLPPVILLDELMRILIDFGEQRIGRQQQQQVMMAQGVTQEINRYIEMHFRDNLTIKKLAELFFLNPVYLGQLLVKKNGMSFHDQLHQLRIQEAARLMEQRGLKNSEIAETVGYNSYAQFLKHFEKITGMSPSEYRNQRS